MKQQLPALRPAGFFSRFGALLIDALSVIVLECFAAAIAVVLIKIVAFTGLLSVTSFSQLNDLMVHHPVISPILTGYFAIIWISFFAYFWTKSRQTPGMKVFRLIIKNDDNTSITVTQALIRLFTSGFGLSNLLIPFDPEKRGFQDIWAQTHVYKIR
ncbi:RDD family protein [Vibrio aerogenes CECT 7868]|uniref:RDD family protein n=1 Tax=Vibrio aerogenes CECT 7868 TaxID=1216006 RepID=A0A1M5US15_9VIBR|nr:RDD family protein [Vibrio aerogenes]SHH65503.1 RDD family protein [Vibrio aerogenes CECT 7868]